MSRTYPDALRTRLLQVLEQDQEETNREENARDMERMRKDDEMRRDHDMRELEALERLAHSMQVLAESVQRLSVNGIHIHGHK